MKFNLASLKASGRRPRVHPNGFIQFDLEPNILRLNVWPTEPIPNHPGRIHPVHNHSFDLYSTIICGALTNITYSFIPSYSLVTHVLHEARRVNQYDTVLAPVLNNFAGFLRVESEMTYAAGQRYSLDRAVLHDSIPNGLTATLMTLEKPSAVYAPQVAVPVKGAPMNDFRRDAYDEAFLWEMINLVLSPM